MVIRYLITLLIMLFLSGCGTSRKRIQQERERTEHTATVRTEQSAEVRTEKEERMITLVNDLGEATARMYNPSGTVQPDGSFTGRADSILLRSQRSTNLLTAVAYRDLTDSVSSSSTSNTDRKIQDRKTEIKQVQKKNAASWQVWLLLAVVITTIIIIVFKRFVKRF